MALTGSYAHTCGTARYGGITKLWVLDQASVVSMTKGSGVTSYSTVTLASGVTGWYKIDFEENTCEWRENLEGERGVYGYTNEIELQIAGLSLAARDFIEKLVNSSPCGLIFIVEDSNGVKWAVGYSDRHGADRPMKVTTANGRTGMVFNEPESGTVITLSNQQAEKCRVVTAAVTEAT